MSDGSQSSSSGVDPGQQRLGAIYAQALIHAAEKVGATDSVIEELDSLVRDVLDVQPQFEAILGSAMIAAEQKEQIIDRAFARAASPLFINFLKVLARHGRLGNVRAIQRQAHEIYNELRNRVRVEVTTATPLDPQINSQLVDRLRGMLGREPVLANQLNPALIGGILLRVGDTVYDGSVATQLNRLSAQIVSRSIHEIQSRRDRFSNPAGN